MGIKARKNASLLIYTKRPIQRTTFLQFQGKVGKPLRSFFLSLERDIEIFFFISSYRFSSEFEMALFVFISYYCYVYDILSVISKISFELIFNMFQENLLLFLSVLSSRIHAPLRTLVCHHR